MEAASAYARANQLRPGTVEEVKSNFGIVSEARQKYLAEVAAAEAHSRAMDLLLDRAEAAWKAKHPESTNPPPIPDPKPPAPAAGALTGNSIGVDLVREMGVLKVPVLINGAITLKFVVDSGASDVHIPRDVFLTLMRAETIKESDFLPGSTFVLADGSKVKSDRFILRSIKVGGSTCTDVEASIGGLNSTLLLGQSFLSRFPEWKINNKDGKLILNK